MLLWSLSGKSCCGKLKHWLPFFLRLDWLWSFVKFLVCFFTPVDFPLAFVAGLCFADGFVRLGLLFLFACVITVSAVERTWPAVDLLLSRLIYVSVLWFPSVILGFGFLLLTVNCGICGLWWLVSCQTEPGISFLLRCLFLSTWRFSFSPFLSLAVTGIRLIVVSLPLLLFQVLPWVLGRIRLSGCRIAVAGGNSTILCLVLNSQAELKARDGHRSASGCGTGRGSVMVIIKIIRNSRKSGERRRSHLWPQQSLDHTLQACSKTETK